MKSSPPLRSTSTRTSSFRTQVCTSVMYYSSHVACCVWQPGVFRCDWKPKRCQHCNMVIISRDLARHEAACKTSVKACPHCSESVRTRARCEYCAVWCAGLRAAALSHYRCHKRHWRRTPLDAPSGRSSVSAAASSSQRTRSSRTRRTASSYQLLGTLLLPPRRRRQHHHHEWGQ